MEMEVSVTFILPTQFLSTIRRVTPFNTSELSPNTHPRSLRPVEWVFRTTTLVAGNLEWAASSCRLCPVCRVFFCLGACAWLDHFQNGSPWARGWGKRET